MVVLDVLIAFDDMSDVRMPSFYLSVIPAKAGIQWYSVDACTYHWTPACAGVTIKNHNDFMTLCRNIFNVPTLLHRHVF